MEGAGAGRPSRSLEHLGARTLLETETHIKALKGEHLPLDTPSHSSDWEQRPLDPSVDIKIS